MSIGSILSFAQNLYSSELRIPKIFFSNQLSWTQSIKSSIDDLHLRRLEKSITIKKLELILEIIKDCVSNLCWALGNNEQHLSLGLPLGFSPGHWESRASLGCCSSRCTGYKVHFWRKAHVGENLHHLHFKLKNHFATSALQTFKILKTAWFDARIWPIILIFEREGI